MIITKLQQFIIFNCDRPNTDINTLLSSVSSKISNIQKPNSTGGSLLSWAPGVPSQMSQLQPNTIYLVNSKVDQLGYEIPGAVEATGYCGGVSSITPTPTLTPTITPTTTPAVTPSVTPVFGGNLYAWGINQQGQIGDGNINAGGGIFDSYTPKLINSGYTKISCGVSHSIGLKSNGDIYTWGLNNLGQLGLGDGVSNNVLVPTRAGIESGFLEISGGGYFTLALKSNGDLYASGQNESGQLGDNSTINSSIFKKVGQGFSQISGGLNHSLALKSNGDLYAWGDNSWKQVNSSQTQQFLTPQFIGSGYKKISAGGYFSLAIKNNGDLVAWGVGSVVSYPNVGPFSDISSGSDFALALDVNGNLYSWGSNIKNQLGKSASGGQYDLVPVGSGYIKISAGNYHSLGIRNNGDLYGWGYGMIYGGGYSPSIDISTPTKIGEGYSHISTGYLHSLALK